MKLAHQAVNRRDVAWARNGARQRFKPKIGVIDHRILCRNLGCMIWLSAGYSNKSAWGLLSNIGKNPAEYAGA